MKSGLAVIVIFAPAAMFFSSCGYKPEISWEAVCEGLIKCDEAYGGETVEGCVETWETADEILRDIYLEAYKECILKGDCFSDISSYCQDEAISSVPEISADWFLAEWCRVSERCDQQTTYDECYESASAGKGMILPINDATLECAANCVDTPDCVNFLEGKDACWESCGIYWGF